MYLESRWYVFHDLKLMKKVLKYTEYIAFTCSGASLKRGKNSSQSNFLCPSTICAGYAMGELERMI